MARENEAGPLTRLVLRFVINTGSLVGAAYILNYFAPNSTDTSGWQSALTSGPIAIANWQSALATGAVFGLVNALIRPLVSLFTCLLQLLTLGLFTLIINALMLLLTSWVAELLQIGFQVNGFGAAFFGAILVSLVSMVLTRALR